jgi:hypothetical protein
VPVSGVRASVASLESPVVGRWRVKREERLGLVAVGVIKGRRGVL